LSDELVAHRAMFASAAVAGIADGLPTLCVWLDAGRRLVLKAAV